MDKLAQSESSPLVVQLLLVIAQLVHLDTNQLIDCLATQPAPGACLLCSLSAPQPAITTSIDSTQTLFFVMRNFLLTADYSG